jgi:hypothetical protein
VGLDRVVEAGRREIGEKSKSRPEENNKMQVRTKINDGSVLLYHFSFHGGGAYRSNDSTRECFPVCFKTTIVS